MDVFAAVMVMFPDYHFSHGDIVQEDENPDGSIVVKLEITGVKRK